MQPRRRRRPARGRVADARDVRCELAYLGEDVSDDDATLQTARCVERAYEEEEEEEASEDDEAAPEAIDNRSEERGAVRGSRRGGPGTGPWTTPPGRATGTWRRWARPWPSRSAVGARRRGDDFAYHMRRARGVLTRLVSIL